MVKRPVNNRAMFVSVLTGQQAEKGNEMLSNPSVMRACECQILRYTNY